MRIIRNILAILIFIAVLLSGYFILHINKALKLRNKQNINLTIIRFLFKIICIVSDIRVQIKGEEKIGLGKYLFAANHTSCFDHAAMFVAIKVPFRFTAVSVLFRLPIIGFCLKEIETIPIERSFLAEKAENIINITSQALKEKSILIYPEGRFARDGQLLPFRRGAAEMAWHAKVPVIPLTIKGAFNILPAMPHKTMGKGLKFVGYLLFLLGSTVLSKKSGKIEVTVGEPLNFLPNETTEEFTERLRNYFVKELAKS